MTLKEQIELNKKEMSEFNKPYKTAVAIDCAHIGDDNDYSCFLSNAIYELWKAGKKDIALTLANTDPMLINKWKPETLEQYELDHVKFLKEQEENHAAYSRLNID